MRLDCERLTYRRSEGLIRALEDVFLRRGEQELPNPRPDPVPV